MSVLFMKLANIVVKPQDCSRTFIMPIFPIIIMIEFIWKNGVNNKALYFDFDWTNAYRYDEGLCDVKKRLTKIHLKC